VADLLCPLFGKEVGTGGEVRPGGEVGVGDEGLKRAQS